MEGKKYKIVSMKIFFYTIMSVKYINFVINCTK